MPAQLSNLLQSDDGPVAAAARPARPCRRSPAAPRSSSRIPTDATRRCARESLRRDAEETPKLLKLAGIGARLAGEDVSGLAPSRAVHDGHPRPRRARRPRCRRARARADPRAVRRDARRHGRHPGGRRISTGDRSAESRCRVPLPPSRGADRGASRAARLLCNPPRLAGAGSARQTRRAAGFFRPDAFTNPEYVQHALRTTGAAMTCYLLYTAPAVEQDSYVFHHLLHRLAGHGRRFDSRSSRSALPGASSAPRRGSGHRLRHSAHVFDSPSSSRWSFWEPACRPGWRAAVRRSPMRGFKWPLPFSFACCSTTPPEPTW